MNAVDDGAPKRPACSPCGFAAGGSGVMLGRDVQACVSHGEQQVCPRVPPSQECVSSELRPEEASCSPPPLSARIVP